MEREISQALDVTDKLQKAHDKAPSLDDLKAELGDAVQATVDSEGRVNGTIRGHDAVMRAWQMQHPYHMARADIAENRQATVQRVPMRGRDGKVRYVAEEREDRSGRKHGAVRLASVRFGKPRRVDEFKRLSGRVPFDFEEEE
jgi:hypothetical protein